MCTAHKTVSRMLTHTAFTVSTLVPIEEPLNDGEILNITVLVKSTRKKKKKNETIARFRFYFSPHGAM